MVLRAGVEALLEAVGVGHVLAGAAGLADLGAVHVLVGIVLAGGNALEIASFLEELVVLWARFSCSTDFNTISGTGYLLYNIIFVWATCYAKSSIQV